MLKNLVQQMQKIKLQTWVRVRIRGLSSAILKQFRIHVMGIGKQPGEDFKMEIAWLCLSPTLITLCHKIQITRARHWRLRTAEKLNK